MRIVRCADPLHATRSGQPGFSDIIGHRPLPDGPDVVVPGLLCDACGKIFHDNRILETEARRTAREAALVKFLLDNPSISRAELSSILGIDLGSGATGSSR